jgi:arsenate reductase (thioredoxin)
MSDKKRILFLCTGNSCRSQMAEGLTRFLKGDSLEVYSAGTNPQTLNPDAVQVMKEIGIDISDHYSKSVESLFRVKLDYVITVCGDANEHCPVWPGGGPVTHKGFDDPPQLAAHSRNHEEKLEHYRRVRDEIREYVLTLPESLTREHR